MARPEHSNPARGIKRYDERQRTRFLSIIELGRLGAELDRVEAGLAWLPSITAAIRLAALTWCRLGEVLTLKWEKVDIERSTLDLPDAKAGARSHTIGTEAIMLLRAIRPDPAKGWVFTGKDPAKPLSENTVESAWKRLRQRTGIADARLHDLRHTVGTYASQTGANAFLVRDKLGHKTLAMTGRYVNQDAAPLRVLSDRVEGRIAGALAGKTAEAITFPKANRRRRAE